MATNSKGDNETKTISMSREMFEESQARRKSLKFRNYSAYIQRLIERDLETGGQLVIQARGAVNSEKVDRSAEQLAAAALNEVAGGAPRLTV